ncbi:uncharacterized protein LOC130925006 isoform X4 [Corythoichthys intestinalis]|uniref:uncharacterized protein LOC130925006 isoform X4 n=1 Tax=Corythoichthys intestinalis TaxID=161448 RepID=UPI0025A4E427|nr:uncharacterized protein LOC130925006 isoform X4 [Corythoichthys intestinalis]
MEEFQQKQYIHSTQHLSTHPGLAFFRVPFSQPNELLQNILIGCDKTPLTEGQRNPEHQVIESEVEDEERKSRPRRGTDKTVPQMSL